jgi:acetylglutamate kinase
MDRGLMSEPLLLEPTEVVLRFLESVGRRSDAEFYLGLFRAEAKERFACIAVDGPVIADALDAVVLDLRFLAALGLAPIVAVGLFDATDATAQAARLAQALEGVGVSCRVLSPGLQLAAAAAHEMRDGHVVVVPYTPAFASTEAARFVALGDLVVTLSTRKLIFLQRRGGLRHDGKLVPLVNLTQDFEALLASEELSRKQKAILREAERLVCSRTTQKITVAITSPLELLRELFTVKGAGTLLRRGSRITRRDGLASVDKDRLRTLLESAFGRPVVDAFFEKEVSCVYLDEDYRAAAVLVDTELGVYLSKFAVEREAQGEGLGGDLWEKVTHDHPVMFWRSRRGNPIDPWYIRQCDGLVRLPAWNVFWKGFAPDRIAAAVDYALAQPADFSGAAAAPSPTE